MKISVRRLRADDHDDLERLQIECLGKELVMDPEHGAWWIAWDGDHPVGYCALVPSVRYPHSGYMARAGVTASHRGNGIQKKLIRARVNFAPKLGFVMLYSDTVYGNIPSANNLISEGFRLYKPDKPYSVGHSLYFFKKVL
jgi:GNAT superfamily N-acetyltransferase